MIMVKSIKYPNKSEIGICNKCSNLKSLRKIITCNKIKIKLKTTVNSPNVIEKFKLKTQGMDEIGDVPKLALVIKLTPRELINNPIKKMI